MKTGDVTMHTVPTEILRQMGGNRFIAMTGAKDFLGSKDSLMFELPRLAKNKANKVRVTLSENDTYRVEFFRMKRFDFEKISEHSEVYCDMLTELFTNQTGLQTRL
jgi:hypothetical protein